MWPLPPFAVAPGLPVCNHSVQILWYMHVVQPAAQKPLGVAKSHLHPLHQHEGGSEMSTTPRHLSAVPENIMSHFMGQEDRKGEQKNGTSLVLFGGKSEEGGPDSHLS